MEQFKGTKGKWFKAGDIIDDESGNEIAKVQGVFNNETETHNANLISAAPDLLKALHDLLVYAVENDLHSEFTNNAEIAIKKALK